MKKFTLLLLLSLAAFFLNAQDNPVFNWEKIDFGTGENLKSMAIEGNNAFIAGYGNAFLKSTDGGTSWDALDLFNPMYTFLDISIKGNVGFTMSNKEKLYDASPDVYANGFVLKTTDGGATWNAIESSFGTEDDPVINPQATLSHGMDFQSVETVNDSVAFCALRWYEYQKDGNDSHAGIFKTKDGGENWFNVSGDLDNNVTTAIVFNGEKGFAAGNKHLYKATVEADTLVDIFAAMPGDGSDYISDVTIVDENEILLTTTGDSIYFSYDGGTTFDKFPGIKSGWDIARVNDSTLVVGYSSNKSYVSFDNGQSWKALGITTSIWEIPGVINDSINMLAKSAIYKCAVTDLLAGNFIFSVQDLGVGNLQKAHVTGTNMIVVGNDNNFFKSDDSGETWMQVEIPEIPAVEEFMEEVDFETVSMVSNEGYACFNRIKFVDYPSAAEEADIYWSGGVAYTEDNWATSKLIDVAKLGKENPDDTSVNPNHADCNAVNTSLLKFLGDDVVLLWVRWYDYSAADRSEHSRVFKTTDGGKNWEAITEDLGTKYVQDIVVEGDSILYIVGKELLLRSTSPNLKSAYEMPDFTDLYPVLDEGEDDAMFIKTVWPEGDDLFVITSVDSCFMSKDGGVSFSSMGNIKGSSDFYRFDANSYMMMGSSGKSIFTNNDGVKWVDCHPGTTVYSIGGEYNGNIYALAKGVAYATSVADLDLKTSTQEIVLDNELNILYRSTSVDLVTSEKEMIRCDVYDIAGRLISTAEPNNRMYRLNNNEYKTGIYIVKAQVDGNVFTEKIFMK